LAGVIVRADEWSHLNGQLEALKKGRGFSSALEIKWRHVRNPGGSKNPLNAFTDADRIQFGKDVLGIIRSSATSRVLGVVIDKVTAYTRAEITGPETVYERRSDVHHGTLSILLARDGGLWSGDPRSTTRKAGCAIASFLSKSPGWRNAVDAFSEHHRKCFLGTVAL
jgi:hypothetical protein